MLIERPYCTYFTRGYFTTRILYIPEETDKAIAIMHNNPSTFVDSPDGSTKQFVTTAGIQQGDTLAPFLFVIVVDYILRQSIDCLGSKGLGIKPTQSRRLKSKQLTDLDYADDIAFTADHLQDAQDLLTCLENAAAKVRKAKKTEYMTINEDKVHHDIKSNNGTVLKEVDDYIYLGTFGSERISTLLAQRRARFAGHCPRAQDQPVSRVISWRLLCSNRGRRPFTYMAVLARDLNLSVDDICSLMKEKELWRSLVQSIPTAVDR